MVERVRIGAQMPLALVLAILALAAGCGEGGEAERIPLGGALPEEVLEPLPPELQAQLDSGNLAYRERDYPRALRHFEAAVRHEPELAAGWYGVGMTQAALGNAAAADSAMAEVHLRAPSVPLQHPATTAPPNPHPMPTEDPGS